MAQPLPKLRSLLVLAEALQQHLTLPAASRVLCWSCTRSAQFAGVFAQGISPLFPSALALLVPPACTCVGLGPPYPTCLASRSTHQGNAPRIRASCDGGCAVGGWLCHRRQTDPQTAVLFPSGANAHNCLQGRGGWGWVQAALSTVSAHPAWGWPGPSSWGWWCPTEGHQLCHRRAWDLCVSGRREPRWGLCGSRVSPLSAAQSPSLCGDARGAALVTGASQGVPRETLP